QVQLKESEPGLVTASGLLLTSNSVSWIPHPPGKGLESIGAIWSGGSTHYSSSLKYRLSIHSDTSKSQVFLKMNSMQTDDTGTYYSTRNTVKEVQCELAQNFPYRDS
uniref:Immunoglobulin V-set domain-containing protein n=1 Tax=Rattus norvegicus TaxID=10116 RepID=A0ABK0LH59_RAT